MNRQAVASAFGAEVASDPARRFPRSLAGSFDGVIQRATVPFPLARAGGLDLPRPTCPCCGQDWAERSQFDAMLAVLSPVARKAVRIISRRPGIMGCDLADAVYADAEDGGPETGIGSIASVLVHNKHRMAAHGFSVQGRKGRGGYWLIRIDPQIGGAQ